jgi:hypothetical protein
MVEPHFSRVASYCCTAAILGRTVDELTCHRTYFTVTDDEGNGHPAVEYLAAMLDDESVFQVMPLKRFVKLIGSGEPLESLGDGRFIGTYSRRTYSAQPR